MTAIDKVQYLQIGVQGENAAMNVELDMTAWAEQYPDATFHILFKPYNEPEVSPQTSIYDSSTHVLTWIVGAGATAIVGVGYTEIRAQDGGNLIKKTRIIPTAVENSVSGVEVNPPAAYADWVTNVLNAGAAAVALSHGTEINFSISDDGHLVYSFTDEDEETVTVDLGPVDAYGIAVEAGYPRTREQFEDELANVKDYSDIAEAAAEAAEICKNYAQTFVGAPRTAATADDMTDENLIYVFTGTTTASLTNGHWYFYDGEEWSDGGVYNSTALTTDTTLTVSGAAADAKVAGDKLTELKSATNFNDYGTTETFTSTYTRTASIKAEDGTNGTTGFRTTYIEYTKPMKISFNKPGEKFVVWAYSNATADSGVLSPTKSYVTGTVYLPLISSTVKRLRIGFHKDNGGTYTEEEAAASFAAVEFRSQTDKTLLLENVPADAKTTGDRFNSVETAIEKGKNTYTVIKSYTLATDYTGDDYIVVSDKKPGVSGWTDDNTMVTILLPDDGSVQRLTVFRNNSVYSCGSDGVIVSTWANESVPNSSVSYGRKPNGTRADYIAFIISKTHIANTNYNTIITNTATFYTPFIEKGETVIFKNGILQADYDLKMPAFSLGNLYANGDIISSTTRSFAPWMNIKKGTVIDTSCTAVDLIICGVSATQKVYVSSTDYVTNGRRYTFVEDTYCVIRFDISSWNIEASAPTLDTPTQGEYFIRYILPEEIAKNPWNGKTWYSYGTSISDIGVGDTSGNNGSIGKWPLCVDALSGMTRTNGAIGSGSIMPSSSSGGNEKAAILQCPFNVDLVTLELGPNDNYWDNLGQVGDTGDDTFLGNLYQIYDYLTKNTRALIVFVGIGARNLTGSTSNIVPANGEFRTRYRTMLDAVKKLSDLFGIPVIDADANACNLNRRIKGVVMRDYIHYTYLGGEIYGRYVWSQLKDMRPYYKFVSGS